ncbi:MAG: radical SAM protein [Candidatus Pacebacteria bacterium]|nr:radical SAM protein [Candidatus Paceibacterota bacterium]
MYREFKSPLTVQLEITSKCNHRCTHCYNYWRSDNSIETTLTEIDLIKIMENLRNSEIMQMVITGGEPMIFSNLLIKGLELAKDFGIRCSINSNSTLVTSEIAQAIKRNNSSVLTSMLSFDPDKHDSLTNSRGSCARLVKGIKMLIDEGVSVGVNMVVMKQNLYDVYKTGSFANSLGVKNFTSTKVCPSLGDNIFEKLKLDKDDNLILFDQLLRLKNESGIDVDTLTAYPSCLSQDWNKYGKFLLGRSCSAGKTFCAIGSSGKLRACVQHDEEYGNAITEPITSIWKKLGKWRDGSLLPDKCKKCQYLYLCGAGCRATCQFFGDIKSLDPDASDSCDFKPITDEKNKIELIDKNLRLKVNPIIRFREEKFGTVLNTSKSRITVVTNDSAYLLKKLIDRGVFTLDEIFCDYSLNIESAHKFMSALYSKNVLVKEDLSK